MSWSTGRRDARAAACKRREIRDSADPEIHLHRQPAAPEAKAPKPSNAARKNICPATITTASNAAGTRARTPYACPWHSRVCMRTLTDNRRREDVSMPLENPPPWWGFDLELSLHVEDRMIVMPW